MATATMLTVVGSSIAAAAGSAVPPPVSTAKWQHAMRQLRVPGKGCFAASYPMVQWRRTQCKAAPHHPYAEHHPAAPAPHRPQTVGNGTNYSAVVTGNPLSGVTGSVDGITPGTTETGQQNGSGGQIPNTFSLQLNTQHFTTPACSGSPAGSGCQGWEQFVYSTTYNGIFIQYWLLNYDTTCPSGWNTYGSDCWKNSPGSQLSGSALTVQQLPNVTLTGNASTSSDTVTLTTASQTITVNTGNVLDLAANWTSIEWAIVGDCCASQANFSSGTTLILRTAVNNGSTNMIPSCALEGFTGETNNLNLPAGPGLGEQALQSGETSSTPAGSPSCADAYLIGSGPGSGISVRAGNPTGEADLVTEGANHTLQYYWATPGSPWRHLQVAGTGTTYSAPSIFVRTNGEADIVAEGPNHTLQYYWATPGSPWRHLQVAGTGTTYSAPSIFVRSLDPVGEADIVAEGASNSLQYYWATPGSPFGHVQAAGTGTTYSASPIFVRSLDPEGEANIVAEGASHTLQYYWATPGSPFHNMQAAGTGTTYSG